jgi:hypothetical protein
MGAEEPDRNGSCPILEGRLREANLIAVELLLAKASAASLAAAGAREPFANTGS